MIPFPFQRGGLGFSLANQQAPSTEFFDEVMADSPFLYYRLNEVSGTALADSSGNSRPGGISGIPGTAYDLNQAGLVNDGDKAILFKDNTGFIRTNSQFTFGLTNVTLMAAIKPNVSAPAGSVMGLYELTDPTNPSGARDRMLYINTSGELVAMVFDGASVRTVATPFTVNDGVARLIHMVIGTTQTDIYVNGTSVANMPYVAGFSYSAYLYGAMNDNSGHPGGANAGLKGVLDEFAWFASALSPSRCLAQAQAAGLA